MHDSGYIQKTELVMVFLEIDTAGAVKKIHLLGENQGPKSLFGILNQIQPSYYNNKKLLKAARDKTIIFLIYSMKYWRDKDNYMDKMRTLIVLFKRKI
jgi:hypothetical protein